MEDLQNVIEWLRFDTTKNAFPREFGRWRHVVHDFDEFCNLYRQMIDGDCWASVYSYEQIYEHRYDTIFIDFDFADSWWRSREDMNDIMAELEGFVKKMLNAFPRVRLYHSGKKGFHVYLDFGQEVELLHFKTAARELVLNNVEEFEELSKGIDTKTLGNIRVLARVVGSIRQDVGRRMIKLDPHQDWEYWLFCIEEQLEMDSVNSLNMSNVAGVEELIKLDIKNRERAEEEVEMKTKQLIPRSLKDKPVPPCVVKCYDELSSSGELRHEGRILLALWMIYSGATDDEIVEVFRGANDFKESYTRYQIQHLRRRGYMIYKCKNIMSFGLCPYKCELYPWVMKDE